MTSGVAGHLAARGGGRICRPFSGLLLKMEVGIVAVAPGSTMLNASASGRDADFPGSRGSGVSGT